MGKAIPTQHRAVVLCSQHRQLRALLAVAMIAVIGLSAAVVILATRGDRDTGAVPATQVTAPAQTDGISAQLSPDVAPTGRPGTRRDGGPEEGSRGVVPAYRPGTRRDGGPEEGTRGPGR